MFVPSDLFSVAVVFYELLTGCQPFGGQTYEELARSIVVEAPPTIASLRPDIPAAICKVCMKGLAKDPLERYPSALAFANALRSLTVDSVTESGTKVRKSLWSGPS